MLNFLELMHILAINPEDAEEKKPSLYEQAILAIQRLGGRGSKEQKEIFEEHEGDNAVLGKPQAWTKIYGQRLECLGHVWLQHREGLVRALCVLLTVVITLAATQYFNQPSSSSGSELSAVPMVQVSPVTTLTTKEIIVPSVSVATSSASNSLQTTRRTTSPRRVP